MKGIREGNDEETICQNLVCAAVSGAAERV